MCATAEPGRFQCSPTETSSAARGDRRSFQKEKVPDFSRNFFEKNPMKIEKNPVLLS
jgi:hypothetical protein